jgi:hypothetical protein
MKGRKVKSMESFAIINGKPGDSFYTHKKDKDVTAIATYYKKKVSTERIIAISKKEDSPISTMITKVTLL